MTYHFYNCLKLIQTVNNNYHHIVELEELHNLLETSYIQPNFWRDSAKVEYEILAKICFETKWNHYSDKHLEWDVETILAKLEGKTRDEIEAMDITTIIPKQWRSNTSRIINNLNNNMKKLEDLSELPENMLEIKEDRSEISLKDLIDNFYTQSLQDDCSEL